VTDRLIRLTTALAVVAVASVAAIISYQHAYELVRAHGESGLTARLLPFTVDGLIWAASMVVLDASRRNQRVPRLALLSLGAGIMATIGANLAHGLGHGWIGALVSAWPALALVGSFELLMLLVRTASRTASAMPTDRLVPANADEPIIDEVVRAMYQKGTSQRAIARELNIDRRKVKRAISEAAGHPAGRDRFPAEGREPCDRGDSIRG
jgi:Protein of unknown function (DUF2637)